jgi:hypothetical protein
MHQSNSGWEGWRGRNACKCGQGRHMLQKLLDVLWSDGCEVQGHTRTGVGTSFCVARSSASVGLVRYLTDARIKRMHTYKRTEPCILGDCAVQRLPQVPAKTVSHCVLWERRVLVMTECSNGEPRQTARSRSSAATTMPGSGRGEALRVSSTVTPNSEGTSAAAI